jgi:PBSX family phage terminase large subunit
MIYRKFSKRQLLAMTWWNRPRWKQFDAIICDGAVRSGKTVCMTDGFFLWSMANFNGAVFGICGKTISALRRNLVMHLDDWLGEVSTFTEHRGENNLVVTDPSGRKNTYYLFGGQDESAAALIQGITLAGVLLDEAALLNRAFLEQACARCSVSGAKLWFSCNPEGPEHWFYTQWVCKAQKKNLLHLHFTMQDNPGLDEAVRQRYERLYTGLFYKRFVLGQWCRAEGLVYDFDRSRHVTHKIPERGRYFISVDYGTMNPFSAGLWCVDGQRAVRVKEFYYSGREQGKMMTDMDYSRQLEKLAAGYTVEKVIVDPSAASFIAQLRRDGRFSVRKARNAVMPGIQLVSRLLETGRLQIGADCANAIREFSQYRWQEGGQDLPCKEDDHAMDEIRYFCATVLGRIWG